MFCGDCAAGTLMLFVVVSSIVMSGSCVANEVVPQCEDGIKSGDETDVDCGGPHCGPCKDDQACMLGSDCLSSSCSPCTKDGCAGNVCSMPRCDDHVTNGDETDTDCGGTCPSKCAEHQKCAEKNDCLSDFCVQGGCVLQCNNMVLDGTETDTDCGGVCTSKCTDGKKCKGAIDCLSGLCDLGVGVCVSQCNNKVPDGTETDVDCGGSCPKPCVELQKCVKGTDCSSGFCLQDVCVSQCHNEAADGDETDVDCGGSCSTKCSVGRDCNSNEDCISAICTGGRCVPDSTNSACFNAMQDGLETGSDCGGGSCPACKAGEGCLLDSDCTVQFKCQGAAGMKTCQQVP